MNSGENIAFAKVEKRKLVDQVLAQLRRIIQSGRYNIGDRIPTEAELMRLLDVGRSTVREAVQILAHAGILEVRQGHGTFIRSISIKHSQEDNRKRSFKEIFEVRRILETQILVLAAERRTEEDLSKIKSHLDARNKYLKNGRYTDYINSDIKFHIAICEATHNSMLIEMYSKLCESLYQIFNLSIIDSESYKDNTDYHENLYLTILNKDSEEAVKWSELNLNEFKSKYEGKD